MSIPMRSGGAPFSSSSLRCILQYRLPRRRMQRLKPVDVVIAGGGLVGLTLAKEITARTSLSVVVLERGQPRKLSDYAAGMDELDYALRYRMMQNLSEETATHRHSSKAGAVPIRQYGSFNPGTGVGGAGEHWG